MAYTYPFLQCAAVLTTYARRDRFTTESAEEREARLEQIKARRRATESTEEKGQTTEEA